MAYKYYTNLDKYRAGLKKMEKERNALEKPQAGEMQVGGMNVKPSDIVRMLGGAAPFIGAGLGAAVGGVGGLAAGGWTGPGAIGTAGAGAAGGVTAGGALGSAAGAGLTGWASQMEKDEEERKSKLASREQLILSLV